MAKRAGSEEQAQGAQVPPTRQTGPESATGAALRTDQTIPQGEDRGSKVEPEGGWPTPDADGPNNRGGQTEPARFTSNGQLPHNTVPSPTGAVPVGALALSPEDARARVEETNIAHDDYVEKKGTRARLPAETVQRLGTAELRAIGQKRGYDIPETGTRATREAFLAAQDEDEEVQAREDRVAAARAGSTEAKPRTSGRAAAKKSSRR